MIEELKKLQDLRFAKKRFSDINDTALKAVIESPEYMRTKGLIDECVQQIEELEASIKEQALAKFAETGEKKMAGVTVKEFTKINMTDEKAAFAWASEQGKYLTLDKRNLDKFAKATIDIDPLPFYEKTTEHQAQIASDLSDI